MWERRYGYPNPQRADNGDRLYDDDQLDKLVLIRQLLDQGKRPGKLVSLPVPELQSMLRLPVAEVNRAELIALLQAGNATAVHDWLEERIQQRGLRNFVHKVMAPSICMVGEAWSNGEVAIFEEHLFTEALKSLAHKSLADYFNRQGEPRIMLTTVPGEKHGLGLLMVEILLRLGGAEVISFGTEMPSREIREAAETHQAQIIVLSFSASFRTEDALVMLAGLRQLIGSTIRIWAGGGAFPSDIQMPEGIEFVDGLLGVETALGQWQRAGV